MLSVINIHKIKQTFYDKTLGQFEHKLSILSLEQGLCPQRMLFTRCYYHVCCSVLFRLIKRIG